MHLRTYLPTVPIAAWASLRLRQGFCTSHVADPGRVRAVRRSQDRSQSVQIRLRTWYGIEAARAVTAAPVRS